MLPTMTALLLHWHGHRSPKRKEACALIPPPSFLQSMQMIIVCHEAGRVTSSYCAHIKCTSPVYFPINNSVGSRDIVHLRKRTRPPMVNPSAKCCSSYILWPVCGIHLVSAHIHTSTPIQYSVADKSVNYASMQGFGSQCLFAYSNSSKNSPFRSNGECPLVWKISA